MKTEAQFREELLQFANDNGFIVEIGKITKVKTEDD